MKLDIGKAIFGHDFKPTGRVISKAHAQVPLTVLLGHRGTSGQFYLAEGSRSLVVCEASIDGRKIFFLGDKRGCKNDLRLFELPSEFSLVKLAVNTAEKSSAGKASSKYYHMSIGGDLVFFAPLTSTDLVLQGASFYMLVNEFEGLTLAEVVDKVERKTILGALSKTGGKRAEAAKLLYISETTLWRRMTDRGILFEGSEQPTASIDIVIPLETAILNAEKAAITATLKRFNGSIEQTARALKTHITILQRQIRQLEIDIK